MQKNQDCPRKLLCIARSRNSTRHAARRDSISALSISASSPQVKLIIVTIILTCHPRACGDPETQRLRLLRIKLSLQKSAAYN